MLVIRVSVLRRLQRFETTARLISAGDLARRVPGEGSDTLSWLAREFDTMADAVERDWSARCGPSRNASRW